MHWIDDIQFELRHIAKSRRDVRKFGLLVGAIFIILGLFDIWFFGMWSWILGLVLFIGGMVYPHALLPLYIVWMSFAVIIGFCISRILLVLIFYLVITPIGIAKRLFGTHDIAMTYDATASTYWKKREEQNNIEKLS